MDSETDVPSTPSLTNPPAKTKIKTKTRDPVRRAVLGLLVLAAILFVYTVIADKLTPFSSEASVQAFLVRIAPEVSGRVDNVAVDDNSMVKTGDLLFQIDPSAYQIAVAQASARLAQVGQTLGASTAGVDTAQSRVAEALATRNNARDQAFRVLELVRRGVYSHARGDEAAVTLARAEAGLQGANSELERARLELGPSDANNPQLREALGGLERAKLDLVHTQVFAPGPGVVTNVQLAPGTFISAGQPALTFLDSRAIWITVMMRENSLEFIKAGTEASLVFDALPGRVYHARVESTGWGIGGTTAIDSTTGLLTQPRMNGDPRRFPVTLVLTSDYPGHLRYGSQATVLFYAHGNLVMNAIGAIVLRAYSLLTYLS
ncbi:HlyD family secretion protein [Acidisoma cellulosilytica]|uniref:HlyD family secretion protein n=1 Tax=Acidisoma cellulosilyticum TaxID=2802395 RepID=A0A963Z095_9PROT|nr:HlyD family secretion protein [Acidisoma cellulosilyticum]MCB8879455.1 HlyD family secretion protein [Acidisoma cellulosilyticum]